MQKTRIDFLWAVAVLLLAAPAVSQETFPQPKELQRDVDFWVDIFSHYSTSQGVLHDNRNLALSTKVSTCQPVSAAASATVGYPKDASTTKEY